MKKLTMIALSAALLGGMSVVYAQNAPTTKDVNSPANINKGSLSTKPSGNESQQSAKPGMDRVAGTAKYCVKMSGNGSLDCRFASIQQCKSANKGNNFECVTNPNTGTTGSK